MGDVLKAIAGNNALLTFAVGMVGLLALTVAVILVWAFVQGRNITFWPPAIGPRPALENRATVVAPPTSTATEDRQHWPPSVGTVLSTGSRRLSIKERIYTGSAASVYTATPTDAPQETVVVKALWVGPESDQGLVKAFKNEARTTSRLRHSNIAAPYDVGEYAGYPFLVMEYFAGGSLRDWMNTHDRMRGSDVISVAHQLFSAVDYAHSQGVIHRDIKPGNILFESDPQGRVALSDFGIARLIGAAEIPISAVALRPAGTLSYISPEALKGEPLTTSADIYSCGVVLYEMMAGTSPFSTAVRSFGSILHAILQGPPNIQQFKSDVSDRVAKRLAMTLSPDGVNRPTTAGAIIAGLEDDILLLK